MAKTIINLCGFQRGKVLLRDGVALIFRLDMKVRDEDSLMVTFSVTD